MNSKFTMIHLPSPHYDSIWLLHLTLPHLAVFRTTSCTTYSFFLSMRYTCNSWPFLCQHHTLLVYCSLQCKELLNLLICAGVMVIFINVKQIITVVFSSLHLIPNMDHMCCTFFIFSLKIMHNQFPVP
jgi:hypothetical protein